ncbi:hypothetical protein ACLIR7_09650 [Nitratireductor aquimarinus]|uniref:hypothetical protein n=1 Tax=Nitratireductor aquimarinus TaxID=889300 RepID=UPI00398F2BAD
MATDVERLIVRLEATQRTFEKQMAKATQSANRSARQIEGRFAQMNKKLEGSFVGLGRSFAGAFAGGILAGGATGLISSIRGVVSELSQMGKEMDRVGLSAKAFQEFRFGFELAGVAQSEFTKGMEQFAKRIGEASMGTGRLFEILKANGVSIRDVNGRFKTTEELLRVYADLIKNAGSEQERMTLATEAFGRGGASFTNALKNGVDGLDAMSAAADEAGGHIDEKLIRKAEELDDEWAVAWRKFEIAAKSAILEVIPYIEKLDNKARDFLSYLPVVMLSDYLFGDAPETVDAIQQEIDTLERRLEQLQQTIEKNTELGFDNSHALAAVSEVEARIAALRGQMQGANAEAQRAYAVGTPGDPNALAGQASQAGVRATTPPTVLPTVSTGSSSSGRGGGGRRRGGGGGGSRQNDLQREIEMIKERTASLQAMTAAQATVNPLIDDYGFALERATAIAELENAAKKAGLEITPQLSEQIRQLATAYATATVESEKLAESQDNARQQADDLKDLGKDVLGGFINDLRNGVDAAEALEGALQKVADKLLDMALNNLIAGLFGGGFGGGGLLSLFGFAKGGIAAHGKPQPLPRFAKGGVARSASIFGEAGPEAAVPLPDGRRIPVDLRGPSASGSRGTSISMPLTINAPGADAAQLARVEESVKQLARNVPKMVDKRTDIRTTRNTRP